jgi:REP element-mobilizing transposase RayT
MKTDCIRVWTLDKNIYGCFSVQGGWGCNPRFIGFAGDFMAGQARGLKSPASEWQCQRNKEGAMGRYRVLDEGGIYFTTSTIVSWMKVFTEPKYFNIIIESLKFCQQRKGLIIYGYVIMLNHLHIIADAIEKVRLSDVMRDFKKYTSKAISAELEKDNRRLELYVFRKAAEREKETQQYKVWQNAFHPQIVYTPKVFRQKLEYMHLNPVRKGFVEKPEYWAYSSARNYILADHSVIQVELVELT